MAPCYKSINLKNYFEAIIFRYSHFIVLLSRTSFINQHLAYVQVVTALGKVWHPEHFVCTECETELGSRNFFEKDGRPYCESDYFTLFSPHCAHCNKPILNVRNLDVPCAETYSQIKSFGAHTRHAI